MEQIKLNIEKLRPGTILNGRITTSDGALLYSSRTIFTKDIISRLRSEKISEIRYEPNIPRKIPKTDFEKMEEEKLEQALDGYHKGAVSRDSVKNSITSLREATFNFLRGQESIDILSCKFAIKAIYNEIKYNSSALINLLDIKLHDDYTFCHSINVGIISLNLAMKMGYNDEEVQLIGLGGFMHDIGKIAIPASLINKTTILSEEEKRIMKSHPAHSYRIMRLDPNISPRILNMAYEHHERYDGKGYPRGISGDKLDDYSVIVALADVYDALTTVRSYKPAFSPEESIQVIETYTGSHFAPRIADKFIKDIQNSINAKNQFTKGALVLLSTNEVAQILLYRENTDGADVVLQILTDKEGNKLKHPLKITLKEQTERKLVRVINPKELNGDADSFHVQKLTSTNL